MDYAVFPACAGVILIHGAGHIFLVGFPRMRGGDPAAVLTRDLCMPFSPHARG